MIQDIVDAKKHLSKVIKRDNNRSMTTINQSKKNGSKKLKKSRNNVKQEINDNNQEKENDKDNNKEKMSPPKKKNKLKGKHSHHLYLRNNDETNNSELIVNARNNNNGENLNDVNDKKINEYIKYKEILQYNGREYNTLRYEKALICDQRTLIQYYISLLRCEHLLIFSFYVNNTDYNSQIIKMFLFFFFFAVHLTVNTLFFNDKTMHKIYLDEGSFNFIYQLPQIICSNFISFIITSIVKYLSLTENNILRVKHEKNIKILEVKFKRLMKILKIKFLLFFIITFLFLMLLGYYNICFCGIYINTQIHLFKDCLISFGLSLLYPFGIYLIPSLLRIKALNAKNKDKRYLYKFSQIIQNI